MEIGELYKLFGDWLLIVEINSKIAQCYELMTGEVTYVTASKMHLNWRYA